MDVKESSLLEELVGSISEVVSDSCHRANQLCAGSQVSMLSEELVGVALGGQGVCGAIALADNFTRVLLRVAHLQLEKLALCRTLDELSLEFVGRTNLANRHFVEAGHRAINNYLQRCHACSIGQFHKGEVLAAHAGSASPPSHLDDVIQIGLVVVD